MRFLFEKNREKGFTLIELMIAMVVVVSVLAGFMGTNVAIQQTTESAFQRTVALQDANQVVELMRQTAATGTFPTNVTAVYANGGTVSGFTSLTSETVTVSYVSASANPLDATVTVSWLQNGRRTVNTALRTLITQRA